MSNFGTGENTHFPHTPSIPSTSVGTATTSIVSSTTVPAQCATYMFPPTVTTMLGVSGELMVNNSAQKKHTRSMSHGGSGCVSAGPAGRPSALKNSRGHQRALSQGQVGQFADTGSLKPGHSRGGSRTNFELPPGHKDIEDLPPGSASRVSAKGHSRQASRSESIYTLRRTEVPGLWRRFTNFVLRRSQRSDPDDGRYRIVVPNHIVPPKTPKKDHPNGKRVDNRIRTTKYTLLSFLPRNLLEQFHRVANLYFIFIVLLNWFPAINAFGKEVALIPVMFVLGVTAVKDLFEDRRRHASDKRINNSTCRIYKSEDERYRKVLWKDVRVGDLIHLSNNEIVPADVLLLRSSDPNGLCYIDTGHLDGETNLKLRQVARGFVEKQDVFEPSKFRSVIEVDAPSTKIYRFHGAMIHPNGERVPLGTENLLLRECLLKNTDYVEGIVVYAGHETKAMLNNGGPRYKRSKLERQMNLDVIWCVLILIILCVIGAIGCTLWLSVYPKLENVPFIPNTGSPEYEGFLAFWTFIIILQILIPLSLYVTIELSKILQVYHIHNDVELFDQLTNKRIECRALNITEDLGQIQYIFSDKTGTLTENQMIFRHCCISGHDYNHPGIGKNVKIKPGMSIPITINMQLHEDLCQLGTYQLVHEQMMQNPKYCHASRIQEFLLVLALCNTVVVSRHPHHDVMNASGVIESVPSVLEESENNFTDASAIGGQLAQPIVTNDRYARLTESRSITPSPPLGNQSVVNDIRKVPHVPSLSPVSASEISPPADENPTTSKTKSPPNRPHLLALPSLLFSNCRRNGNQSKTEVPANTITPSPADFTPIFEAESPDELALVDAAYVYDCKLLKRTPQFATVSVPGKGLLEFEILNILPFDSTRKCMSIIFRHPMTQEITLYCKGADSVVLSKLANVPEGSDAKEIIFKTQQQLNNYGRQGLRVLVMAKRILSESEYAQWFNKNTECELSTDNRDRKIRENYSKIECNLTLIGATGIEDRLQEGVPETLTALTSAGIVVWVLTGDKPETAINIAYSAKLFSPQMEVLNLMTRSKDAAESTISFYLNEIDKQQKDYAPSNEILCAPLPRSSELVMKKTDRKRALVVDGKTLTFILDKRSNLTKPFLKLSCQCSSVLCCRATPLQKAYIVKVVKEELRMRTLAIGDGANDVSMIQTADVGIGISGQEGMQAVMAADFAMSRFRFLERFLLVHGHWCYDRLSRMVLYFFYKNAAFVFLIFWYQLYCGFSGAVMIDDMYLMLYNLLFTSLPPLAIGVYDQVAPEDVLTDEPYLYRQSRLGLVYKAHSFWLTMADALYQSIAIFFVAQAAYHDTEVGMWEFGTTITTSCMVTMLVHAAIETRSWTLLHATSSFLSIAGFFVFSIAYNSISVQILGLPNTYWVIQRAMCTHIYWLIILLTCVIALLPRMLYMVLRTSLWPDDVTSSLIARKKSRSRGESFLVSWSRSSSASSICRATSLRSKNNTLTAVG